MGELMKIKDMPETLRPREKALRLGVSSLDDRELLALFLRTGTKDKSALELADDILCNIHSLSELIRIKISDLIKIKGIKEAKAIEILALFEMAKRMAKPNLKERVAIYENNGIIQWLNMTIGYENQEHFMVLFLNNQQHILSYSTLFIGTVDYSVVHPRDIFREAVTLNSTRIILVHNHPGGSMMASTADIHATQAIVRAGMLLGIEVLDHLIVSEGMYYSIRNHHPFLFED